MFNFIFVAAILIFTTSCESLKAARSNIFGPTITRQDFIGTHISKARDLFGEPTRITKIDSSIEAWYYEKSFVVFRDNKIISIDSYSAPFYNLDIVSFADNIPKNKKIAIVSGIQSIPTEDLEFQSRSRPFKYILRKKDYQIVEINENPDYVAVLKYGVSEPMVEYRAWSTPVYSWVPGQTITINHNGNSSSYTSTSNGTIHYAGERVHTEKTTSFRRYLVVEVLDYKAIKKGALRQLWKIECNSIGATNDIDTVLVAMYAATSGYWEKPSRGQKSGAIAANDPMLIYLKGLL